MKINAESENYHTFTEWNFVSLFLPLLCKNGIYRIQKQDLEEKLFYYYENREFKELFQEIFPVSGMNNAQISLYDGLATEKYVYGSLIDDGDHLNLVYPKDMDLSVREQYLSEDGKRKIRQMALELSKRYEKEKDSKVKLDIYGIDPNHNYSLVHGKNQGFLLSNELITDGNISIISHEKIEMKRLEYYHFYKNPINPNEAVQLEDNMVLNAEVENATYTINQGLCDGNIRYCHVDTQLLDDEKLEKIVNIANQRHENSKNTLNLKSPYVRKITLR